MPIHDWTLVTAGIFHHFHHAWIFTIQHYLNDGCLPDNYYALAEQVAGGLGPDVLTLETGGTVFEEPSDANGNPPQSPDRSDIGLATATVPPQVMFTAEAEPALLVRRKNRVVIRHSSDHRVVAVVEILSPGNKGSQRAFDALLQKADEFIRAGVHLLVLDLWPPGPRDPQGFHAALWSGFDHRPFTLPEGKPLTLAAYSAGLVPRAYIQPMAVGESLPEMPLFLEPENYIPVPLESTYTAAFEQVPKIWRRQIEPDSK